MRVKKDKERQGRRERKDKEGKANETNGKEKKYRESIGVKGKVKEWKK